MRAQPKPTPTLTNALVDPSYWNNEATVVISNISSNGNEIEDDATASTEPSTDQEPSDDKQEAKDMVPPTVTIPHEILPWDGRTTNKTSEKWKRRVESRAKQRQWKEANNPRAKPKGELWMNMVRESNLQQSPNSHMMFNTKQLVKLVEYALSDSGAS